MIVCIVVGTTGKMTFVSHRVRFRVIVWSSIIRSVGKIVGRSRLDKGFVYDRLVLRFSQKPLNAFDTALLLTSPSSRIIGDDCFTLVLVIHA